MKKQQAKGSGMKRLALSVTFLASSLAPLTTYGADGVLRGRVTDKADGEGVVGAAVSIAGTNIATATDIDGNFVLRNVPASKQQKVTVTSIGYAPTTQVINLGDGQTATLNFTLGQTTIMASEVVVGAALYKQDRLDVPVTANVVSNEKIKEEPAASLDTVIEDVPGVNINRSAGYSTSTVQIRGSNTFQGGAIGTRVNAFYDGFPINTPDTGEVVWTTVNMNSANKVEVLKGAAATLYGSGAMGGVVNVYGSLPEKFEVKLGASAGLYDTPASSDKSIYRNGFTPWLWNGYVGIGNKSEKLNYSLLYSHDENDGYKENTWTSLDDVKLKLRYDINSKQYIQLSSFYSESRGGYASTWPYDVNVDFNFVLPPIVLPGGTVINAPDIDNATASVATSFNPDTSRRYDAVDDVYADDTIKRKNALIGLNYVNLLSDKLSLDTKLYYTYNSTRIDYNPTSQTQTYGFQYDPVFTLDFLPFPLTGTQVTLSQVQSNPAYASILSSLPAAFQRGLPVLTIYDRAPGEFNETKASRYGAGLKLDWRAMDNHRLLFGFDGNIVDVKSTQYVADLPAEGELGGITEKNIAFFLQDEWKITDRLTALLSARYDWSNINANTTTYVDYSVNPNVPSACPTVTEKIQHDSVDALSPRLALNYKVADDMALRASWGRSFRAPTLAERFVRDAGLFKGNPNPALNKETMTAYEVGVYKQFGDKVSVDIAGYINNYDDLIESRNLNPDYWPIVFQYTNVTKARIWGIETSVNWRPNAEWAFSCGYAYMNAKNKSTDASSLAGNQNPDPEWLAYRPEHTASASTTWKPTSKLALNLNGRYVSKYKAVSSYPNPEGDNYPGGFIVMNAGIKYSFSNKITASLICKNIGNLQYEEAEWFPSAGRTYIAGIDLTY